MIEIIRNMTPEQWLTNVICPLIVGILLLPTPIVGCPVLSLVLIVWNARWLRIDYRTVVSATEDVLTSDQKEVLASQLQEGVFITRRKRADSRLNVAYLLSFVGIVLLVLALGFS